MGRMPYLAYLWPGLPTVLANGSWLGLGWAAVFAVLVNLQILASVWWPELLPSHARNGLWVATAVFWMGASLATLRALRLLHPEESPAAEVGFGDATRLYLRGDWFGTERVLTELLQKNSRDVEAGLMLATLWRHTGRTKEASQQLDRLELLDGARRWMLEIHQERKYLRAAASVGPAEVEASRAA